jgi:hypothetical protein
MRSKILSLTYAVIALSRQPGQRQRTGTLSPRRCFSVVPGKLYEILGVSKTASKTVIKAAFRKVGVLHAPCTDFTESEMNDVLRWYSKSLFHLQKARELHPDLREDVHDAGFVNLLQAYEVRKFIYAIGFSTALKNVCYGAHVPSG